MHGVRACEGIDNGQSYGRPVINRGTLISRGVSYIRDVCLINTVINYTRVEGRVRGRRRGDFSSRRPAAVYCYPKPSLLRCFATAA